MKRVLLLSAVVALGSFSIANAQTYSPDFSCSPPPPNNGVALMLCQNSEAAKHELILDQSYYALRQIVGKDGWKALKQQLILEQNSMDTSCGLPVPGDGDQTVPANGPACYIQGTDKITAELRSRLSGSSLEEATRPIDTHVALQRRLIDLGYLPAGTLADGVYGEGTRLAIQTWQRVTHRPVVDGFLSNADAATLTAVAQNYSSPVTNVTVATPYENFVAKVCGGVISPVPSNNSPDYDPFTIEGKCFSLSEAIPNSYVQWINAQTALIPALSFYFLGDQHWRFDLPLLLLGTKPHQYTAASGAAVTPMTFLVVGYLGGPLLFKP